MRHDVPGCINVFDLNITIAPNTVNLTGFCYEGDILIKYDFHVHLWGSIDEEDSKWIKESVGGIQIVLAKDEP